MPDTPDPPETDQRRFPLRALALVALLSAVGYAGWMALTGPEDDVTLPPGFTITAGEDSGTGAGTGGPSGSPTDLESLIAATTFGESEGFQASIAILPLENRTGDTLLDTLGNGMAAELVTRLSRIRGLKVISLQSVRELGGLDLTTEEVADTLGVDHLLQGTAFPYQDVARFQVRLVQVGENTELWRNDYSLDRTNQMRAVEDISDEVSAALLEEVPTLSLRGSVHSTDSPGYAAYLAGSGLLNTRTRDGLIRAIDAFELALEADSGFALAYAGLSSAYALSVTYRYDIGVDAYAASGLALTAADKAVRLDPDLAEAYAARGYISSVAQAPTQPVLEDFSRALELQPNAPNVPAWYAHLLVREGYYDEALEEARRAVELDPLSPARRTGLAYEALRARDYDLAITHAQDAQTLSEEVILPRSIEALALLLSSRAEECLDVDLGPHAGLRAMCLHDLGRIDQAEAITDSLKGVLRSGSQAHPDFTNAIQAGDMAAYLSWTGTPEQAMQWIHRAYALSPSGIDTRVLNSGVFEAVFDNGQMRREVAEIRDRIWTRVRREWVEAAGVPPGGGS